MKKNNIELKDLKPKDYEEFIENFFEAFTTDDQSYEKTGHILLHSYIKGNEKVKKIMNDMMITLCGYSFDTLLNDQFVGR